MIFGEDTVGMMTNAQGMFVFLLYVESEALTAMSHPDNHYGA